METTDFHNEVRQYINLQKELMFLFVKAHPNCSDFDFLLDFPSAGTVSTHEETWAFQKHGAGLCFRNNKTGAVVDIHKYVDHPEYVDEWRLRQYLQSKQLDDTDIAKIFNQFCSSDFLEEVEKVDGVYRMVS